MSKKRLNFLSRVQNVVAEYQIYNDTTRSTATIWRLYIYPKFSISYGTLLRYLSVNVHQERKKLNRD